MKTDLAKILSVSGQRGLFLYIAQSRGGAIAESLADKKRTNFDARSRITTLEDIAIYTSEGEMKLAEVFRHSRPQEKPPRPSLPRPTSRRSSSRRFRHTTPTVSMSRI